jgi:hypothetical protein
MLIAGVLLSARLALGDLRIGGIILSYHTLIFTCAAIVIGWQMVFFWMFAKRVAIRSGLLRNDPAFERLRRLIGFERGAVAGALLTIGGLGLALDALLTWYQTGFGPLDDLRLLRAVCLASTALVLGAQVVFSTFFLYLLDYAEPHPEPPPPVSAVGAASKARSSAQGP